MNQIDKDKEIATLLVIGVPMKTIAKTVGVSLSAVQRVKKKIKLNH